MVSNCHSHPLFMLSDSTNSKSLRTFCGLIQTYRVSSASQKKIVLALDLHSTHHCKKNNIRKYLKDNFNPIYFPPSTPWFNSAEFLFSALKRRIRRHFTLLDKDLKTPVAFYKHVQMICDATAKELEWTRIFSSNVYELRKALDTELSLNNL